MPSAAYWLAALVVTLQIGDGVTTIIALRRANLAEGNPVAARVMDLVGVIRAVVALKLAAAALAIFVATVPIFATSRVMILAVVAIAYAWVVADNFRLIRRSGRERVE